MDWRQPAASSRRARSSSAIPKQSIYRFRRADIDIYNIVRERFSDPSVGRVVPLTMNFRSVAPLCDLGERRLQDPVPGGADHPCAALCRAGRAIENRPQCGGVFTLTHGLKEIQAQDAAKIARYIRSEVDAGRRAASVTS